jgi:HJR/Mrr/RecB family endonuclease
MPTVFVSYAYADSDNRLLTQLLHDLRQRAQVHLWLDREQIDHGDDILSRISGGIAESDFFLLITSRQSIGRAWPQRELKLAFDRQARQQHSSIIPVLIDEALPPKDVQGLSIVSLVPDYEDGFQQLLRLFYPSEDTLVQFDIGSDGQSPIIQLSDSVNRKMIEYFQKHPQELEHIDRRKFEELVAELFVGFGYNVELTQQTRDHGRDVIAIGQREVTAKYLIECKRPNPGGYVGVRPVRELFGVKTHEGATKAILATTAYFSRDALVFFEQHKWELEPRDHAGLMDWIKRYLSIPR